MFSVREHFFASGFKLHYLFSEVQSLCLDDIEELKNFFIEGPISVEFNEKSPLYRESLTSRALLLEALKFYKTKNVGGVAFSLSHTRGAALLAAAASLKFEGARLAAGIGADLESAQRKISEAAHKRIVNGGLDSKVQALHLWCLKEAAYKAHPDNEHLLLSDFYVDQILPNSYQLKCLKTGLVFECSSLDLSGYILSFARKI